MASAKRISDLLLAFGLVAALSCKYDPQPPNGTQLCAAPPAKRCPDGYNCHTDGKCWTTPEILSGAGGSTPDAPQATGGSGGNDGGGGKTGTRTGTKTNTGTATGTVTATGTATDTATVTGTVTATGTVTVTGTDTGPTCGTENQPCCAGNTCINIAHTCSAGYCVLCGLRDQPCCTASTACRNTNIECIGGTCQPSDQDAGGPTSTGTGTTTVHDAGIATTTNTATGTVRDAGLDAATATATGTTTAKGDAGIDAPTATRTNTSSRIVTLPLTGKITSTLVQPLSH